MWRCVGLVCSLLLFPAIISAQTAPTPGQWIGQGDQNLIVGMTIESGSLRWFEIAFNHGACRTREYAVAHVPIANGAFTAIGNGNILYTTIKGQFSSSTSATGTIEFSWVGCGTGRLNWTARLEGSAPSPVTQPTPPQNPSPTVCRISQIAVDTTLSNDAIRADLEGTPCQTIINIKNPRNYWTNFAVSTIGSVRVEPIGGDDNLFVLTGLLPPSGLIVNSPLPIAYLATFSGPGMVTVLVDPTIELGFRGHMMNVAQIVLGFIPGGNSVAWSAGAVTTIENAFQRMPHLDAFSSALFRADISMALREFVAFIFNFSEWKTFLSLVEDLGVSLGAELVSEIIDTFLRGAMTIIETALNVRDGYAAGSISVRGS